MINRNIDGAISKKMLLIVVFLTTLVILLVTFVSLLTTDTREGGEVVELSGELVHEGNLRFKLEELDKPGKADPQNVIISVMAGGTYTDIIMDSGNWNGLSDGYVVTGSSFNLATVETQSGEFDAVDQTFNGQPIEEVAFSVRGHEDWLTVEL